MLATLVVWGGSTALISTIPCSTSLIWPGIVGSVKKRMQLWPSTWRTCKASSCVNLGITFAGLGALELPPEHLASFPTEYVEGAAARATGVGDVGGSAPDRWLPWLTGEGPHLLLSLFAQSVDALEATTRELERAWYAGCTETGRHDGAWLPDSLPRAPVGEFLLGYPSQHVERMTPNTRTTAGPEVCSACSSASACAISSNS